MNANIWEFSLYFPRELLCYFETLKKELKSNFSNDKNCIDILIKDDFYVFMLALEREVYNKNILMIKDKIADIILLYYKPKIIISSIQNFDLTNQENIILIDILTSLEKSVDRAVIVQNLSLIEKLFLDSFVSFKLGFLTKKWKEVAGLINENSFFLLDAGIKLELMQFLMQGLNNDIECAKLTTNGLKIDNQIVETKPIFYSQNPNDNIIFSLINLYPNKIEVENYKTFDVHFVETLGKLFGERVTFIE